MKEMNRLLSLLLLVGFPMLSACNKNDLEPDVIPMRIADHRQDCVGVGPQKCLLIKTDSDTNWQFFYNAIEGFGYEEGFEYQLLVRREKVDNPPADGSSVRYTLVEVVEKIKM